MRLDLRPRARALQLQRLFVAHYQRPLNLSSICDIASLFLFSHYPPCIEDSVDTSCYFLCSLFLQAHHLSLVERTTEEYCSFCSLGGLSKCALSFQKKNQQISRFRRITSLCFFTFPSSLLRFDFLFSLYTYIYYFSIRLVLLFFE